MAKLYPPVINGTIPAFTGYELKVPFSMNQAVSKSEVKGFALKIKTVSGGSIANLEASIGDAFNSNKVIFNTSNCSLQPGQYYKLQLAYIGEEQIGYYSTVGVVKYTLKPKVYISGLGERNINTFVENMVGICEYGESTEKMYSSRFYLYDKNNVLLYDTKDILHNVSEDDSATMGKEIFNNKYPLEENQIYYLKYEITTFNGLVQSSVPYRLVYKDSLGPKLNLKLAAELDYDNAYIKLSIEDYTKSMLTAQIIISRAASDENYYWREIKRINLNSVKVNNWYFRDLTIQHGITYQYSLQIVNSNGIKFNRILSDKITAKFEDTFLLDEDRQLRIRFDPKVSTFKTNILENKVETIGSKYPFIYKNARVKYKELSISGQLSYLIDPEELFMDFEDEVEFERRLQTEHNPLDELNIKDYSSTDLSDENMYKERVFKLEAIEWLQNGKPKLFKSAAEGNYIVRLMNISTATNDNLSRMLRSFTATAYEIDELNFENLIKRKLLNTGLENIISDYSSETITKWGTFLLRDYYKPNDNTLTYDFIGSSFGENVEQAKTTDGQVISSACDNIRITGMIPGSMVHINGEKIVIGVTGAYYYKNKVNTLSIENQFLTQGQVEYQYKGNIELEMDIINDFDLIDVPLQQIIGNELGKDCDILEKIQDVRTKISTIGFVRFKKRDTYDVFLDIDSLNILKQNGINTQFSQLNLFKDMNCSEVFTEFNNGSNLVYYDDKIYRLRMPRSANPDSYYDSFYNEGWWVDAMNEQVAPHTNYAIDGKTKKIFQWYDFDYVKVPLTKEDFKRDKYYVLSTNGYTLSNEFKKNEQYYSKNVKSDVYSVLVNDKVIDIEETEEFYFDKTESLKSIVPNEGVVTELNYIQEIRHYKFETQQNNNVYNNLKSYNEAHFWLLEALKYSNELENISGDIFNKDYQEISQLYKNYKFNNPNLYNTIRNNKKTIQWLRNNYQNKYSTFINSLKQTVKDYEEIYGVIL